METLFLGLVWYAGFLFSTVAHEAAHAWAAWRGGDHTAYEGGQVSLDPLPHIRREPFGTVVLPILSYIMGGWMVGWASTPFDPLWAGRHPRRAALMSLAGPAANLALVLAAAALIRLGMLAGWFAAPDSITLAGVVEAVGGGGLARAVALVLSVLFTLNLVLFVFNLLPVPPLDGSSVVTLAMSGETARRFQSWIGQPLLRYLGLFLAWRVFAVAFDPVHRRAVNLLFPECHYR